MGTDGHGHGHGHGHIEYGMEQHMYSIQHTAYNIYYTESSVLTLIYIYIYILHACMHVTFSISHIGGALHRVRACYIHYMSRNLHTCTLLKYLPLSSM